MKMMCYNMCSDEYYEKEGLESVMKKIGVGGRWRRPEGRNPHPAGLFQGPHLVAGQFEHLGGGADESYPVGGAGRGKVWILREETVAGVDRVGIGFLRYANDLVDVQVCLHGMIPLPDKVGLGCQIGRAHV